MTSVPAVAVDCVGYVRVSTEDQARADRTSLADQRAAIAQLAGRLGRTLGHVFEDPGVSGGSADRPGFTALLAFCCMLAESGARLREAARALRELLKEQPAAANPKRPTYDENVSLDAWEDRWSDALKRMLDAALSPESESSRT